MTFQRKMILAFLVFVLLPVVTLGYISNRISTDTLQKTISRQTVQTLNVLDRNMMEAVTEVNHFSDYVVSSGDIQSFLTSSKEESVFELYNKRQSITGMMYANAKIQQFALYSNTGDRLYQSNEQVTEEEPFFPHRLVQEMKQKKGSAVWLSPSTLSQHPFQQDTSLFLTQGRIINDINTLDPLGYMVLAIRLDLFDDVFASKMDTPSTELLINKEGEILYALDHQWIGKRLAVESLKQVQSGETGFLLDQWNGETHLITYMPSRFQLVGDNDVWIVALKPWDVLASDVVYIRNTTLFIGLLTLMAAVFFNLFYLRRVASFIQALNWNMKQVRSGDLSSRMNAYSLKELNGLSLGFNQMIQRIGELIKQIRREEEKNRQAEFKVLQQQINPHFLYNTLESINALAAMSGQKDISKMTINLGRLLRISINGSYEVLIHQEISHVISYLEIQKIRFNHLFTYEVDIENSLSNERVLKLILQPLVENVLAHAFDQQENGLISIRGTRTDTTGYLWVRDNGKGISANLLEKLHEKRGTSEQQGHGIRNVHERLNLYYGKEYGLMVCSSEQGTIIQIAFPLERGD
ncbi:sensor histidine kinase [Domibacillus sp. A3M-37]|uniref:cache domain-containing sensor histidine kinase n=1 Tax=Domibacillus sp. A3M-37 TaxID=2962037 RepID=UPI0020B64B71|nr:sensor histidine kinase [Domibacillus sp. A3M-37]MCP3763763.1 sensor histidine kinase [Domibacillus sp. A3M-37]